MKIVNSPSIPSRHQGTVLVGIPKWACRLEYRSGQDAVRLHAIFPALIRIKLKHACCSKRLV